MFSEATRAWRRLKLALAEVLVLSLAKGDHTFCHHRLMMDAADAIREFRETYYMPTSAEALRAIKQVKRTF